MDQPGKVANPACGQLNREHEYGMPTTPGTGRLACTGGTVSRFSSEGGSIPVCYARSERRPGSDRYTRAKNARYSG